MSATSITPPTRWRLPETTTSTSPSRPWITSTACWMEGRTWTCSAGNNGRKVFQPSESSFWTFSLASSSGSTVLLSRSGHRANQSVGSNDRDTTIPLASFRPAIGVRDVGTKDDFVEETTVYEVLRSVVLLQLYPHTVQQNAEELYPGTTSGTVEDENALPSHGPESDTSGSRSTFREVGLTQACEGPRQGGRTIPLRW